MVCLVCTWPMLLHPPLSARNKTYIINAMAHTCSTWTAPLVYSLLCRGLDLLILRQLLGSVNVRWRVQRVALLGPDGGKLLLDVIAALLPLVNLSKTLLDLLDFLLDLHLLALSADTLKLPLVAALALAEDEVKRVVLLERGAGGNGNQG